jgi:hypothetical protein
MSSKNHPAHLYNLIAFLAVLLAITGLAVFGEGTDLAIMTGLVGVLGTFRPWGATAPDDKSPAGTRDDPLSVEGGTHSAPVAVRGPRPGDSEGEM